MKESVRSKHYASDKEVKTAEMNWLKKPSREFYEAGIYAFIRWWNIAIERNGDYVDEERCDPLRTSLIFLYR